MDDDIPAKLDRLPDGSLTVNLDDAERIVRDLAAGQVAVDEGTDPRQWLRRARTAPTLEDEGAIT